MLFEHFTILQMRSVRSFFTSIQLTYITSEARSSSLQVLVVKSKVRLFSQLVPEHGTRVQWFSLEATVSWHTFLSSACSYLISCTVPLPGYKVSTLCSGTKELLLIWSIQVLNATPFCAGVNAPSANTALNIFPTLFICARWPFQYCQKLGSNVPFYKFFWSKIIRMIKDTFCYLNVYCKRYFRAIWMTRVTRNNFY